MGRIIMGVVQWLTASFIQIFGILSILGGLIFWFIGGTFVGDKAIILSLTAILIGGILITSGYCYKLNKKEMREKLQSMIPVLMANGASEKGLEQIMTIPPEKEPEPISPVLIANESSEKEPEPIMTISPEKELEEVKFMTCPECNTENDTDANFCKNCGNRIQ